MLLDIKSNMDRLPLNSYKTQANRKVVPRLSEYELDALQQIDLAALEAVDVQTVSPDDLVDLKDIQIDLLSDRLKIPIATNAERSW